MSDLSLVPVPHAPLMASGAECPVLITLGEDGWLKADRARQILQKSQLGSSDIVLKVFTAAETGAAQAHADNPSLANEYIFDWLESARCGRHADLSAVAELKVRARKRMRLRSRGRS